MTQISVSIIDSAVSTSTLDNLNEILDAIRNRAYVLFEQRGGKPGSETNDWMQAERDLFALPQLELSESNREYNIRMSMPGIEGTQIRISTLNNSVFVTASNQRGSSETGEIRFSELESKPLFRRIDLPSAVENAAITASLDKGLLNIRTPKTTASAKTSAARA